MEVKFGFLVMFPFNFLSLRGFWVLIYIRESTVLCTTETCHKTNPTFTLSIIALWRFRWCTYLSVHPCTDANDNGSTDPMRRSETMV